MSATGSRVVITQRPELKAESSRKSACREGSRSRPSCGPGGFWSGSRPSRIRRVRRCAMSFANARPSPMPFQSVNLGLQTKLEQRQEIHRRRRCPPCSLSVEGPAEDKLRGTIIFSRHASEPMVDKRGLPDTGPGNNRCDIDMPV